MSFKIYGVVHEPETYYCQEIAQKIVDYSTSAISIEFEYMLQVDYLNKVEQLKKTINASLIHYKQNHIVLHNNQFVGDVYAFQEFSRTQYEIEPDGMNSIVCNRNVREGTYQLMTERGRPIVFIEFINKNPSADEDTSQYGKVYIELFSDLCPLACENFLKLCSKTNVPGVQTVFHYQGSPIHRIVKDGWLQCGDIVNGSGGNSVACLDRTGTVADESFSVDFGSPLGGIVGFSNSGPHTNGSQFFITTGGCAWMNSKYVGVGRVVQGYSVLRFLNNVPTSNQRPVQNIVVGSCGIAPEPQAAA